MKGEVRKAPITRRDDTYDDYFPLRLLVCSGSRGRGLRGLQGQRGGIHPPEPGKKRISGQEGRWKEEG